MNLQLTFVTFVKSSKKVNVLAQIHEIGRSVAFQNLAYDCQQ